MTVLGSATGSGSPSTRWRVSQLGSRDILSSVAGGGLLTPLFEKSVCTACRLSFWGEDVRWVQSLHVTWFTNFLHVNLVLWCSGYHICFTRRRSPVRPWAGSILFHGYIVYKKKHIFKKYISTNFFITISWRFEEKTEILTIDFPCTCSKWRHLCRLPGRRQDKIT